MQSKLSDPFGNTIVVPGVILNNENCRSFEEIRKVITDPAFVIQIHKHELYFFRLIDMGVNILVIAKVEKLVFLVKTCMQNPTPEYISELLRKGALFPFSSAFKQSVRHSKHDNRS